MTKWYRTIIALAMLVLMAGTTQAQRILDPTDDGYVESSNPTNNLNTSDPDRLWIRAAKTLLRESYLKFDLSHFEGPVEKAELQLTVTLANAAQKHYVYVHGVDTDTWTENDLTFDTKPAYTTPEIVKVEVLKQISTDEKQIMLVDLTAFVNAQLEGDKIVSLSLTNPTANTDPGFDSTDVRIYSRENSLGYDGPKLTITGGTITATEDGTPGKGFSVSGNYPNPFRSGTSVDVNLPKEGVVTAVVYNVLGRQVASVFDGRLAAGKKTITWDGNDVSGVAAPNGLYLIRVSFDGNSKTIVTTLAR